MTVGSPGAGAAVVATAGTVDTAAAVVAAAAVAIRTDACVEYLFFFG